MSFEQLQTILDQFGPVGAIIAFAITIAIAKLRRTTSPATSPTAEPKAVAEVANTGGQSKPVVGDTLSASILDFSAAVSARREKFLLDVDRLTGA